MKLRGAIALALLAISAVAVAPARAASTHDEYVAQVDAICQGYVAQRTAAFKAYTRNVTHLSFAEPKPGRRDFKRAARSLRRLTQVRASLTTQIATVPPPAEDVDAVGVWLGDRRQAEGLYYSAASALNHFRLRAFDRRLAAAGAIFGAGEDAVAGFGFQVCHVNVN
jgi:hypothetical protein